MALSGPEWHHTVTGGEGGGEEDHSTRWPGTTSLARLYKMFGYQWTPLARLTVLGSLELKVPARL